MRGDRTRFSPCPRLHGEAHTSVMTFPCQGARRFYMPDLPTGTVTLLFTDIESSTRLLQQTGERYASVLEECRQMLRAAFSTYGGHEVDTQGDAFFVAFVRATDAVSAAAAVQRTLASHTFPDGVAVRVRMGLHTGEPQHYAEGYVGVDVVHAARTTGARSCSHQRPA